MYWIFRIFNEFFHQTNSTQAKSLSRKHKINSPFSLFLVQERFSSRPATRRMRLRHRLRMPLSRPIWIAQISGSITTSDTLDRPKIVIKQIKQVSFSELLGVLVFLWISSVFEIYSLFAGRHPPDSLSNQSNASRQADFDSGYWATILAEANFTFRRN